MYGDVVMGVQKVGKDDHEPFDEVMDHLKEEAGVKQDTELSAKELKVLVDRFKALIQKRTGKAFPQEPVKQLWGAIGAVFGSWMNDRAIVYRRKYHIPHEWGTAVNVQTMVFGNLGDTSATGVAFTRDPATGEKVFYGEYLINAQGEDVVAGTRTPQPIAKLKPRKCPRRTPNSKASARRWRAISRTCRISSSPSRTTSFTCSRPATGNAPAWRPCDRRRDGRREIDRLEGSGAAACRRIR
jgi:hypothetical protein